LIKELNKRGLVHHVNSEWDSRETLPIN